jgi:cytochrome c oxidase cbb3-type subunit II
MNRAPFLFLGIFLVLSFSFVGVVLTNQISYGSISTHVDEEEGKAFPLQAPGIAAQGKLVYQDLGCVACHTQQVRREGFGSDIGEKSRGWGERQSVARDYLRESRVLLGSQRIGPDLRNYAARKNADGTEHSVAALYAYLYNPQAVVKTSNMPSYAYLFKTQPIIGQGSSKALKLPAALGYEVVPTSRAEALVAYLLSLKDTYAYPETKNVYVAPAVAAGEHSKESHK